MRAGRLFTSFALIAALLLVPAMAPAQTDEAAPFADAPRFDAAAETDSWLGGLAAVGCGVMVRATIITAGTQVGTIAGAVACCAYMLFDLLVLDPH